MSEWTRRFGWMPSLLLAVAPASAQTPVLECPLAGGGDLFMRGFYIPEVPLAALGVVELDLRSAVPVASTVTLTARAGTYDGPIVGTSVISIQAEDWIADPRAPVAGHSDEADAGLGASVHFPAAFPFDGAPVTPGSTVTFKLENVPDSSMFYDPGPCLIGDESCDLCGGEVIETTGTTPPLDEFRRASVGIKIFAAEDAPVPAVSPAAAAALALLMLAASAAALRTRRTSPARGRPRSR